jgi:hypothetical protein
VLGGGARRLSRGRAGDGAFDDPTFAANYARIHAAHILGVPYDTPIGRSLTRRYAALCWRIEAAMASTPDDEAPHARRAVDAAARRMRHVYAAAWNAPFKVFHEDSPARPHVDVFWLDRAEDCSILATAGMSTADLPATGDRRAEIHLRVRPGLPLADVRHFAAWLRLVAITPFKDGFGVRAGHTIGFRAPADTANTARDDVSGSLEACAFVAADRTQSWVARLQQELRDVSLLEVVLLTRAELRLARHAGVDKAASWIRALYGFPTPRRPCFVANETTSFQFECPIVHERVELVQQHVRFADGAIAGGRALACTRASVCSRSAPGPLRPCTWGRSGDHAIPRPAFLPIVH